MRVGNGFCPRLLAVCICGVIAAFDDAGATALDDYVAAPDPAYTCTLAATYSHTGYTDYILYLASQNWLDSSRVNRTLWEHWLAVTVPDTVTSTTGLLRIGSGSNGGSMPGGNSSQLVNIALHTQSVTANLWYIPNQSLTFTGDHPRREDDLIAYAWDKFLRGGDPIWLPRLPMTKAAVRAMDAITDVVDQETGGAVSVTSYVVTGASKRGWTTWTTAAVDPRVVAFAPQVIDLLNLQVSFDHHYAALGYWAAAIIDYVNMDIPMWFNTRPMTELCNLVDPYAYRDRYTMPKFVINSAQDEFFLPDSSQFYYADLPGPKRLRYMPNAGHGLNNQAWQDFEAWYAAILSGAPIPEFTWTKGPDGALTVDTTGFAPSQVLLWQATNPYARDFNIQNVGAIYTSSVLAPVSPGIYQAAVAPPAEGWTAFFIELTYPGGGTYPFKFTTEVSIVPDVLPYSHNPDSDADGEGNKTDSDDDDDGVLNADDEWPADTDNDRLPNLIDTDDDNDGVPDSEDPYPFDTDDDGLRNNADADDDGDGMSDEEEVHWGSDPLDPADLPDMPLAPPLPSALILCLTAILAIRRRAHVHVGDSSG